MAIDSVTAGAFIPNTDGLPPSLALSSTEKALESAQVVAPPVPTQSQEQTEDSGSGGSEARNSGEDAGVNIEV